jgi:hypothetical protein
VTNTAKYPTDYIWAAQESFLLQLEVLDQQPLAAAVEKYYLRNLLISLDRHFVLRNPELEQAGGALQELRDAAELFLHDAKAPVARTYFDELLTEAFAELASAFAE